MHLATRRRPLGLAAAELVCISALWSERHLPALIAPQANGVDLSDWLSSHRPEVETLLARQGGLLFRGFDLRTAADFKRVATSFSTELLEYKERSTPRSRVDSFLYTSTEYPADQVIPLHNENSYAHTWPQHIWFFCERRADSGGETSIADSREVFRLLDAGLRDRFMRRGIMYVRNYSASLGLSWQETFQSDSKSEVERYCRDAGIECQWRDERLTTRQTRKATAVHPTTGEKVWFNQAHLFHASSLPPAVYRALLSTVSEAEFPRHAYYGDGAPLESDALDHIRDVYGQAQEKVRWNTGDVLLLDNMLTAHGRLPYGGPRRILVTMAQTSAAA